MTRDLRTHGVEKIAEIGHLRFAGSIAQARGPLGQRGRHHEILSCAHRHHVKSKVGPAEPAIHPAPDVTLAHRDLGAERFQAFDVLVHGAGADGAAARQGDLGLAKAGQERPEDDEGRPHGFHQLVGCSQLLQAFGRNLNAHLLVDEHAGAHAAEQLDHGRNVLKMRDVAQRHRLVG